MLQKEGKKVKKENAILLVFTFKENSIQPELSSSPLFRIQRGPLSIKHGQRRTWTEILVGYMFYGNRRCCGNAIVRF